jgi:hypothetical protein
MLGTYQNALHDLPIAPDAKHKFSVTCPDVLLVGPNRAHPGTKNSAPMFHAPDTPERTA